MIRITLLLLGLAALFSSKAAIAEDIEAFGCEDCSYSEARTIATQKATPFLQCIPPTGQTEISVDNQQCYSQPRLYYVYSRNSQQVHAFNLHHTNQGGGPLDLVLQVDDITPSSDRLDIIEQSMAIYESKLQALSQISTELSEILTSPEELATSPSTTTYNLAVMSGQSVDDCERSGAYNAVKDAFDLSVKQHMFEKANDFYRTLDGGEFSDFRSLEMTGKNISLSLGDLGFHATMDYVNGSQYITRRYNWVAGISDPTNFEPSELVFRLSIVDGKVQVEVDESFSKIDGISIDSMKHQYATINQTQIISQCAIEALDEIFNETSVEPPMNNGGGGGGLPGDGSGSGGGFPGGFPIGGDEPELCRKHYYIMGERVLTVLAPCP